ncbi:class I SAM-dependent methyltransferase [Aurantiacibacter poecillastricola]|uniref:class I SAM-dependent methyltransferase n=1 Tax=Aurantiacibacter poecillastricola TaxID=3064385 RepID=UPI00273F2ED8|nr:methyltransferase domain-containing protein [Aurantiacibacter sp. 219JJ12-13]MDP5262197.1 methyltransferase domain-containing protein [Aurantiacibacter sp. 219JJ12-13]
MRLRIRFTAAIGAVSLCACSANVSDASGDLASASMTDYIMAAVVSPARPAEDVARDEARKPEQIVAFSGVQRGDVVAEIAPGGGYYTRILAQTVAEEGTVYALMPAFFANRPGGLDTINAIAEQYGNVEVVVVEGYDAINLPQQVDLVWTTENYHDLANNDIAPINAEVNRILKPGGIYFVEDHAAPGTGTSATSTLHRIDPATVREQVIAAGFTLEAESDVLRNPADPHDVSPGDFDGVSDKFAYRFRKPM